MDDKELRRRLKEADALLAQYRLLLTPVLEDLARRKEAATGAKYTGHFGCYEEGINALCIHRADDSPPLKGDDHSPVDWELFMVEKFFNSLEHINLSGFY